MTAVAEERARQIREAQELLGEGSARSLAKSLFFGRLDQDLAFPFPRPSEGESVEFAGTLGRLRSFLEQEVDSSLIDRESRIPAAVIRDSDRKSTRLNSSH